MGAAFLATGGYAGQVLFREIIQHEDGTLGTKFPDEMTPPTGEALHLPFESMTEGATGDGRYVRIRAMEGFGAAMLKDVPANTRISLQVKAEPGSSYFGLCLRGSGKYQQGHELRFEPYRQKVGVRRPESGSLEENEQSSIYNVEGLDRPFDLEVIIKDDIIDVCIDRCRTLVTRVSPLDGNRLFFFAQNAQVTFDSVQISPLLD